MILPMTEASLVISGSSSLHRVVIRRERNDLDRTIICHGDPGTVLGGVNMTFAPGL